MRGSGEEALEAVERLSQDQPRSGFGESAIRAWQLVFNDDVEDSGVRGQGN